MSTTDETKASEYVETAMRSRLGGIRDLVTIADTASSPPMSWEKIADVLEISAEEAEEMDEGVREEANERLYALPLCVEAMTTFEVVLGTGGPDDRLLFECDSYEESRIGADDSYSTTQYEIRRVLYRYSWEGSGEVELHGEDRATAEAFARRVVPELADA